MERWTKPSSSTWSLSAKGNRFRNPRCSYCPHECRLGKPARLDILNGSGVDSCQLGILFLLRARHLGRHRGLLVLTKKRLAGRKPMEQSLGASLLEEALARTEGDADQTLKVAEAFVRSARKLRSAARTGNLKEIRSLVEAGERALAGLRQQFANTKDGWMFDEVKHFESGLFARELMAAGARSDVIIMERDDRLYCYPSLIRVLATDRAVYIDRKREGRVRPSFLVGRLKEIQKKPARFRPETFLAALQAAYVKQVAMQPKWRLEDGPVVLLADIYELFTLLPGQTGEYTKQEFVRDVFLLHKSGVEVTKTGARVSFPTTGRVTAKTLSVIDQSGVEQRYYGIAFSPAPKGG
ncbi:MAG: hypothetical protein HW397_294 [Dehalococcoidia bacterium]|nr:hypothetical protein [Dehalococcoidia bacterium]